MNSEHRTPTQNDWIDIGLTDLENRDEWTALGRTNALIASFFTLDVWLDNIRLIDDDPNIRIKQLQPLPYRSSLMSEWQPTELGC